MILRFLPRSLSVVMTGLLCTSRAAMARDVAGSTASAGPGPIGADPERPDAEILHVAGIKDGANPETRPVTRPVTRLVTCPVNGGPGALPTGSPDTRQSVPGPTTICPARAASAARWGLTGAPRARKRRLVGVTPRRPMFHLQTAGRAAFAADGRAFSCRGQLMRPLGVALAILMPFAALAEDVAARLEAVQTERLRPLDFAPFGEALATFRPPAGIDGFLTIAGITEIQAALAAGELTSETLTLWHLARILRLDDRLRGMLELNPAALDDARASDARRAAGQLRGPLDGIPVSLKDNIGTAGPMHTTANAEILLDRVATADATLVASLRAAGAVIIGKASLSEFAGSFASGYPSGGSGAVGGQGVNPLGPFPTYGSSSGSAISVAAHFAVVSIGTETAGSLVSPAGVMSLVGMKPSAGLVSTEGVVPLIVGNDGPGPIARTVQDAALLLAAIDTADVDYAAGLSADALTGVKVGVLLADIANAGMGTEAMTRTAAALVMLGADPAPVTLDLPPNVFRQFFAYLSAGMRFDMMPVVSAHNQGVVTPEDLIAYNRQDPKRRIPLGQDLLEQFAPLSTDLSAADYASLATEMQTVMTGAMEAAFAAQGGVEVLVSMANLHSIYYATAGYPAITVPVGRKDSGEPVGVTLIGRKGQDARLLSYAYAFQQATRAHIPANLP